MCKFFRLDSVSWDEGEAAREGPWTGVPVAEVPVAASSVKNLKRRRCMAGSLGQTAKSSRDMKFRVKSVGWRSYLA